MNAGNQTLLKKNNQRAITEYIIKHGPISRADLAKKLKISKPTVSANVAELIELDLLQEIGYSKTEIGKKPMLLDFNKNVRFVLALDFISYITWRKISVSMCNLYCEPIFTDSIILPPDFSEDIIRTLVPKMLFELLEKNHIPLSKIGKLVLTAPTFHYDDEHVNFTCQNGDIVNLAEIFKPYFKDKIIVKNDINLAALGEKYFGVGKSADNLFFAWIGLAVGGGIILNGELYEGKDLTGGEMAYCTVYNDVLKKNSMMQETTSMQGIRNYIDAKKDEAAKSSIGDKLLNNTFTFEMITDAIQNGDTFCIEFGKFIGRTVAVVLANIAFTMNLQMVILGGDYLNFGDIFLNEVKKQMSAIPLAPAKLTTPRYSNSAMYGAFKIGTESIIDQLI